MRQTISTVSFLKIIKYIFILIIFFCVIVHVPWIWREDAFELMISRNRMNQGTTITVVEPQFPAPSFIIFRFQPTHDFSWAHDFKEPDELRHDNNRLRASVACDHWGISDGIRNERRDENEEGLVSFFHGKCLNNQHMYLPFQEACVHRLIHLSPPCHYRSALHQVRSSTTPIHCTRTFVTLSTQYRDSNRKPIMLFVHLHFLAPFLAPRLCLN